MAYRSQALKQLSLGVIHIVWTRKDSGLEYRLLQFQCVDAVRCVRLCV